MFALLKPRSGWEFEDFSRYWLRQHGALVASTPGYGKYRTDYVQDHILRRVGPGSEFPYWGVASVRLPGEERAEFASTAQYKTRILPDETQFLDRAACRALSGDEYRFNPPAGQRKCILFGSFSELMDRNAQVRHITETGQQTQRVVLVDDHVNLVALGGLPGPETLPLDWVEEFHFDSEERLRGHLRAREEDNCLRTEWGIVVEEHVLFSRTSKGS